MLSILFNIHFLLGLLIVSLFASFAYFYFTQKLDEQNEKINAMSLVVRAVAEELTYLRANAPSAMGMGGSSSSAPQVRELTLSKSIDLAKEEAYSQGLQLIPVSDDEESDDDESEEEYSSNDEQVEDGMESGSDGSSDYGSEEDEDNEAGQSKNINVCNEVEDIGGTCPVKGVWEGFFKGGSKDIKEENMYDEVILPSPEKGGASGAPFSLLDVTKGMLEVDMNSVSELVDVSELLNKEATNAIEERANVKKVAMTVEEQSAEMVDYKKMPLGKLRAIVVERKLCEDASKMKKPELFKLLNVENVGA
jgi:hypothetical protein